MLSQTTLVIRCESTRGPGTDAWGNDRRPIPWLLLVRLHPTSPRPRRVKTRVNLQLNQVEPSPEHWSVPPGPELHSQQVRFKEFDDTVSSVAESVHTETASSSDLDYSDTEDRGKHRGPRSKEALVLIVGGGGGG